MLSFLKENGFLEAANDKRMTPLMNAAYYNNREVAKELIQMGVNVNNQRERPLLNRRDKGGQTALFYAVKADNYEMALFLLNHGALQLATDEGQTPLHEACNVKMAKLLIERGGNARATNDEEETPLHIASLYGMLDYAKLLISVGVDKDALSEYGRPIQMALVMGQLPVVDFLLEIGCEFEITEHADVLLMWLKQNIDYPGDSLSKFNFKNLKTNGLYETIQHILFSIPVLISEAKSGNVPHFMEKLRNGDHFHAMQVIPYLPEEAKMELTRWAGTIKADMHLLFILFHSNHSAAFLTYPSPIAETLKQMILLPKKTRALLTYF